MKDASEVVRVGERLEGLRALMRRQDCTHEEILRYVAKWSLTDAKFAELWSMVYLLCGGRIR